MTESFYTDSEIDEILERAVKIGLDDDPQLDLMTIGELERMLNYPI
jgi:hypothetical protein